MDIFLSYARENEAKAKALARALESSGHRVWWDRQIHGGTEYSSEIEQAIEKAQTVVVLWSKEAVASGWVRDEAAEGRDSRRLIPVSLDKTRPPMGFRQIQAIDLSDWGGRGAPKRMDQLLAAIERLGSRQAGAVPERGPAGAGTGTRRMRLAVLAAIALLALLAGGWLASRWLTNRTPERATLAVLPFEDLSPARDKAYLTAGIAEEILSSLARDPGIDVIGRSSAARFTAAAADLERLRRQLGVTHVLEGSVRTAGTELRMSVRLIETASGRQLWGQEYQRQLSNIFAVQDDIGRAVAGQLRGSLSAAATRDQNRVTKPETYAIYLDARAQMRERRQAPLEEALRLARQVVAADPDYAPGRALLAEVISLLSYDDYGKLPPNQALQLARPHALAAIRLSPNAAEGHAALGLVMLDHPREAIGPLQRAAELDPARGEVRLWLASTNSLLGNQDAAVGHYRALAEMEPLWQPAIALYSVSLAAAGDYRQAEELVTQFERRGGRPAEAIILRGRFAEMRGDLAEAVRLVEEAGRLEPSMSYTNMLTGWYFHMLGLADSARRAGSAEPGFTRLALAGDDDALAVQARRLGPDVLRQQDSDVAIAALARRRDWPALARLHEPWRKAVNGCVDGPGGGVTAARRRAAMVPLQFARALAAQGRRDEASQLLDCIARALDAQSRGEISHYSLSVGSLEFSRAQIFALGQRREEALGSLERAVDAGWRGWHSTRLADYPGLDNIRGTPGFARVQKKLDGLIERDRLKVLAQEQAEAA